MIDCAECLIGGTECASFAANESDRRETQTADDAICARCVRVDQTVLPRRAGTDGETSVDEGSNVSCVQLPGGLPRAIQSAQLLDSDELKRLIAEADEICAMMSASHGTARYNERNEKRPQ